MRKHFILLAIAGIVSFSAHSQIMISKLVGKNSKNSKLGFGAFAFYEFPLNDEETRSLRLELLDFAFFPRKDKDLNGPLGYVSIKVGYKYVFSESKTGFYLEPQAGYCRTIFEDVNQTDAVTGDGVALALEGGYGIEVGENGNTINFGVKYEKDLTSSATSLSSVGFRVSYSFGLFKRRE